MCIPPRLTHAPFPFGCISMLVLVGLGCTGTENSPADSGRAGDAGERDATSPVDQGPSDTGASDGRVGNADSGQLDSTAVDAGPPFEGCSDTLAGHGEVNAFWSELDQHYAVFDLRLRGRSWNDIGHEACRRLSDSTSDSELFDVILDMGKALDDGHITLEASSLGRNEDAWISGYPHSDVVEDLEGNVESRYVDGDFTWANEDWFAWGRASSVGYVSLTSLR